MKQIIRLLTNLEKSINNEEEHGYFLTHYDRYRFTLEKITEIAQGKKLTILDVGCYPYHVGKVLEELGHDVWGICSPHEKVDHKNIRTLDIENEKIPFKEDFFDLVLFNEILEHLPYSVLPPLREAYRVAKQNGYIILTTPNIARSINRVKLGILGKTIMYPIDVFYENNEKGNVIYHRHNREYTLEEVGTLLTHVGFKASEKRYFIAYSPFRKRKIRDSFYLFIIKYSNYLLMRLFPFLQDTLFIIGKK